MGWLFSHFLLFKAIAESTMIIGADISHTAPGTVDMASMTAMIVSLDKTCPRYGAAVESNGKGKGALVSTRCFDHLSHGGSQMRVVGVVGFLISQDANPNGIKLSEVKTFSS